MIRGEEGIVVWNRASQAANYSDRPREVDALQRFIAESGVSDELQAFARSASGTEFHSSLVQSVRFESGAENLDELKRTVENELMQYARARGVVPGLAKPAMPALFLKAVDTATSHLDRFLDRTELNYVFDDATLVKVTPQDYQQLLEGQAKAEIVATTFLVELPPLYSRFFRRENVFSNISQRLAAHGLVVLFGSSGMGKTLAAIDYAISTKSAWRWVSLRGLDPQSTDGRLRLVLRELRNSRDVSNVVIDDLELQGDTTIFSHTLAQIIDFLRLKERVVIITSYRNLSRPIVIAARISESAQFQIPRLELNEIRELILARGAPAEDALVIAQGVFVTTAGHATLVDARAGTLEEAGFPRPTLEGLFGAEDLGDIKVQAYQVVSALPMEHRNLLYRISVTSHALTRAQILRLAAQSVGSEQPLREPGLILDGLTGPWIESVGADRYRASPLINGYGIANLGDTWQEAAHAAIARAVVRSGEPVELDDALAAFIHAYGGRDDETLTVILASLISSGDTAFRSLSMVAPWLTQVALGGARRPGRVPLLFLRVVQFRLAVELRDASLAGEIVDAFDVEFPLHEDDATSFMARVLFYTQAAVYSIESMETILHRAERLIQLAVDLPRQLSEMLRNIPSIIEDESMADLVSIAGFSALKAINDTNDLEAIVNFLERQGPPTTRRFLSMVENEPLVWTGLIARARRSEMDSPCPNWRRLVSVIERLYQVGRAAGANMTSIMSAASAIRVAGQDGRDFDYAESAFQRFSTELGASEPRLVVARAVVAHCANQPCEALDLWRQSLFAIVSEDDDIEPAFDARFAAIDASETNRWQEAADYLAFGRNRAAVTDRPLMHAGFLADEGYARWRSGDVLGALPLFKSAIELIIAHESRVDEPDFFSLTKRVGHVLLWVTSFEDADVRKRFFQPPAAFDSDPDPIPADKAKEIPATPVDVIIAYLIAYEYKVASTPEIMNAFANRLMSSEALPRALASLVYLNWAIRLGEFDDLIERLHFKLTALEDVAKLRDPEPKKSISNSAPMYNALLGLAYMLDSLQHGDMTSPIALWRAAAVRLDLPDVVTTLDKMSELLGNKRLLEDTVRGKNHENATFQFIAATMLSTIEAPPRPRLMFDCHQIIILHLLEYAPDSPVAHHLVRVFSRCWHYVLDHQQFLLTDPRLTAPALARALEVQGSNWRATLEIMIAAQAATGAPFYDHLLEKLEHVVKTEEKQDSRLGDSGQ